MMIKMGRLWLEIKSYKLREQVQRQETRELESSQAAVSGKFADGRTGISDDFEHAK